jgi:hypothetical protein
LHTKRARRGRPPIFTRDYSNRAVELRNLGFTLNFVAARLGFHRNTVTIHLRAEISRLQPWAFRRKPPRATKAELASVYLRDLKGSHQVHAAHRIVDCWELLHVVVAEGRMPTLRDLARIRGDGEWRGKDFVSQPQEIDSTTRAFYRIKDMLEEQGVSFDKKAQAGEPFARIEIEPSSLSSFLKREVAFAGQVIERHAKKTGKPRRFRGR